MIFLSQISITFCIDCVYGRLRIARGERKLRSTSDWQPILPLAKVALKARAIGIWNSCEVGP